MILYLILAALMLLGFVLSLVGSLHDAHQRAR